MTGRYGHWPSSEARPGCTVLPEIAGGRCLVKLLSHKKLCSAAAAGVLVPQLRRHLHHALQEVDASWRHPCGALEGGLKNARVHGLHPLCCRQLIMARLLVGVIACRAAASTEWWAQRGRFDARLVSLGRSSRWQPPSAPWAGKAS